MQAEWEAGSRPLVSHMTESLQTHCHLCLPSCHLPSVSQPTGGTERGGSDPAKTSDHPIFAPLYLPGARGSSTQRGSDQPGDLLGQGCRTPPDSNLPAGAQVLFHRS